MTANILPNSCCGHDWYLKEEEEEEEKKKSIKIN
jgi:hypothetical protein